MYLRTTTRKNKDGSKVTYYQIAHNDRDPETKKPRAHVIGNLGRSDRLDREALKRLCQSIAKVCGVSIVDLPDSIEGKDGDMKGVVDRVKLLRTLEIGLMSVVEVLWERLGIGKVIRKIIRENGLKDIHDKALMAMTANRLCNPESKLGVWDRWLKEVYFPEGEELKLEHMYWGMDFLHDHSAEIEKSVFYHTANLYNLEVDLIFYDTTTVSFSIDEEDEDMGGDGVGFRKYGHSKEGGWSPQVVVALAVTREGLPVRCWVFPGNTADSSTIERVRSDLRGWKLGRSMFIADAGMNSTSNKAELSRACGKYILAARMSSVSEVKRDVLSRRGPFTVIRDNLHAKEVMVGDGERRRRYILCYNPQEAERQKKHRKEIITKLEGMIKSHEDRRITNKWAIELLASLRYKRYLVITKRNLLRIDRKKVREASRYDGKWVIETNDDTINFEDAACSYKSLLVIEQCFRSLKKAQIKLNPVYHWVPRRIESHVRICVLALLIQRVCELACNMPWSKIRHMLGQVRVTECQTSDHIFFKLNELSPDIKKLFSTLNIPLPKSVLGITHHPKNKQNL